jgi:hypothetical protein
MSIDQTVRHLTLAPGAAFTYQQLFEPGPDGVLLLLKVWDGPAQAKAQLVEAVRSGVLRAIDVTASQLGLLQRLASDDTAADVVREWCSRARAARARSSGGGSVAGQLVALCKPLVARC